MRRHRLEERGHVERASGGRQDFVVEGSGADAAGKFTISGTLCGITADAARHGAKPAVPADASHVLRIEKHYFEDRFGRERAWSVSAICHSDDDGQRFRGQPCHGERPIRGGELGAIRLSERLATHTVAGTAASSVEGAQPGLERPRQE